MRAHDILNNPFLNKGTAFTMEERQELGLIGILPPHVQTIEEQAEQTYQHYLMGSVAKFENQTSPL